MIIDRNTTFEQFYNYMKTLSGLPDTTHKQKDDRRNMVARLRENIERIASVNVGDGVLEAFANCYAVYDTGDHRTVIWIPDCVEIMYNFTPLTEPQRAYMDQQAIIPQDDVYRMPWLTPLIIHGENQIEHNMAHPKCATSASERDTDLCSENPVDLFWAYPQHIDGPEEAYLKKEAWEEWMAKLTDKQREAFELYYKMGYTQEAIAAALEINHRAVGFRLKSGLERLRKNYLPA